MTTAARGRLIIVAAVGAAVFGVAVFLPWAAAAGGLIQVAGWGSGYTPRLRGMLVIACAATALACLAASPIAGAHPARRPQATLVAAAGAALVALVATLLVLGGLAAFAGTSHRTTAGFGLGVALAGEAVTLVAAALAAAPWPAPARDG